MFMRDQQPTLQVRREDTSAFQDWNLTFIIYHFILKGYPISLFQGGNNTIHHIDMTQLYYSPLHKIISETSSTFGSTSAKYDGIGVTLIEQVRGKTLQDIYHSM